jgi:endoglucanase
MSRISLGHVTSGVRPSRTRTRKLTGAVTLVVAALFVSVFVALTHTGASPAFAAKGGPQPPAPGGGASVRVNQVGYPADAAKRAYFMSKTAATGATFAVKNTGGATVYSGTLGASLGAWSTAYGAVQPIDFTAVTAPGIYTITVNVTGASSSPSFKIDTGATVYAQSIGNTLNFYQVQRDGPNFIAGPLRTGAGHLNDASAMTYLTPSYRASTGGFSGDLTALGPRIDATGGWWDAGDYLKFVQTTNYTSAMMLAGVRDFPAQMGSTGWTSEARFGAEWLLKMWDDSTSTLYYQVGIGSGNGKTISDHDIWRLPQADDTYGGTNSIYRYIRNRPVFRAGAPGSLISPNLAGRDAAALAEAYQVFKASDPAFANKCLLAAVHQFDLANTSPGSQLLTVIPFSFYPETEWRDDLEWGATELYFALAGGTPPAGLPHDANYYLQQAAHWANAYIAVGVSDTLNMYDVSGHAHYELSKALAQAGDPSGLEVTRATLLANMKKQLDGAVAQAAKDPFQFGFAWAQWDTTTHGAGLAVMASEYDELTGTGAYTDWTSRWSANILGANAWGTSLIVGDGTTFPTQIQHQVANLVGTLNGTPPVLAGACVEGPNKTATRGTLSGMILPTNWTDVFAQFNGQGAEWQDNLQSYSNTEPAIDLTASSMLMFSRLMAGRY